MGFFPLHRERVPKAGEGCFRRLAPAFKSVTKHTAAPTIPHPALRATLSRREKDSSGAMARCGFTYRAAEPARLFPLPPGEGAKAGEGWFRHLAATVLVDEKSVIHPTFLTGTSGAACQLLPREKHSCGRRLWCDSAERPSKHGFSLSFGRGCRRRVRDGSDASLPPFWWMKRASSTLGFSPAHPALCASFSRREMESAL